MEARNNFYNIYCTLCEKNNIKPYGTEITKELHIAPAQAYKWKKDNSYPTVKVIMKMADKFHVTTDYLLGISDESSLLNDEEKELINIFRSIDAKGRFNIIATSIEEYKDYKDREKK